MPIESKSKKKINDVQTYQEIVAFCEGKQLDEITKNREYGKRNYQKFLLTLGSAILTAIIMSCMYFLFDKIG